MIQYYDINALLGAYLQFAVVATVGGILWQYMQHSSSKSTITQPPSTKSTVRPRIFSPQDVIVGLVFWTVVCIVLYMTTAVIFAGWHIPLKVSDAVLLGTTGVVLLGGLLSGFACFVNWRRLNRSLSYGRILARFSLVIVRNGFIYSKIKPTRQRRRGLSLKKTVVRLIFWCVTLLITWLATSFIWAVIRDIFPHEPFSQIFIPTVMVGTPLTVVAGGLAFISTLLLFEMIRRLESSLMHIPFLASYLYGPGKTATPMVTTKETDSTPC